MRAAAAAPARAPPSVADRRLTPRKTLDTRPILRDVVLIDLWKSEEEFGRLSGVPGGDVIGVYEAGPAARSASASA